MDVAIPRRAVGGVGSGREPVRQPMPHSRSLRDPTLACIFVQEVPRRGLTPGRVTTFDRKEGESFEIGRKVRFLPPSEKGAPSTERVYMVYPSGEFSEEVIRVAEFAKERLKRVAKKTEYQEGSFSYATSVWDGASNISAVARNIFWIENGVNPNPGITKGLGFFSAAGLITGPIHLMDGLSQLKKAKRVGDVAGERLAKLSVLRGGLDIANGGVMAASRTISLVSLHTTSKTIEVAGSALGNFATGLSIGIFAIYAIRFLRTLVGAIKRYREIRDKSDGDAFLELMGKLRLEDSDYKKAFERVGIKSGADCINIETDSIELSQEEIGVFEESEREKIIQELQNQLSKIDRNDPAYKMVLDWGKVERNFVALVIKELAHIKMVKEIEHGRITGGKSLELIRGGYSAAFGEAQQSEIVTIEQKELAKQIVIHSLLVLAVLIGIASFVITTVYTGGAALIVGYVMMLVMNIILTGADTQGLFKSIESLKELSAKQKALMVVFAILIVGVSLTGAFFTGGGSMLVTAIVIGGLMTSVQAGGMYYAWKKQSKNKLTDKDKFHMLKDGQAHEISRKVPKLSSRRRRALSSDPKGVRL